MKRIAVAVVAVVTLGSCQKDAAPRVAATMVAATATTLDPTVVGNVVATVSAVEFLTEGGKPVKNNPMFVSVSAGGGSLLGNPTKSLAGLTPIGTWTLGTGTGIQTVTVNSPGFPPVVFSVTATADVPAGLVMVEGNDQRAPENGTIPAPIRIQVQDQHDNGVPGVTVTWAVDAGGGELPVATTSQSDADGIATAPAWVLGDGGSGEQALTATAAGLTEVRFTAEIQAPAASITIETDAPSSAAVGSSLSPSFAVRDAEGNVLNGVPVTLSVTSGGGSINSPPTVSADGATSVGDWTLGTVPSAQTLTVEVAGVPSVIFATDAVVGPASIISTLAGAGQAAEPGGAITDEIRVKVTDAFLNPVVAGPVTWSVAQGGGIIDDSSTATDSLGETAAPNWSVGNCGGPQTLRATVGSAQGDVGATMNATTYGLEVHWIGPEPGGAVQAAFDAACVRIGETIVAPLDSAVLTNFNTLGCPPVANITGVIRGLRIYASVEVIDGAGGVLGSAGPCWLRPSNNLSILGRMRFDSADLNNLVSNGSIGRVILHEMLHVVGVGTLWTFTELQTGAAPDSTPIFTGPLAKAACITDHGGATPCAPGVPIEDCLGTGVPASCGSGTINAHWKESIFRTELMTGYLNAGFNPFSKMTIQSLADMGYTVDFSGADAYTVPPASLMAELQAWSIKMPTPTLPIGVIDRTGKVIRLMPQQ